MRVVLDPAAAAELREAAVFYEDCREGLGQEFLASVEAAFDAIARRPDLWRRLKGRVRRRGDAPQAQAGLLGISRPVARQF